VNQADGRVSASRVLVGESYRYQKLHRECPQICVSPRKLKVSGLPRTGRFLLRRQTERKRMTTKLHELGREMQRRRHQPISDQGRWLNAVIRGHCVLWRSYQRARGWRRFVLRSRGSGIAHHCVEANVVGSPGLGCAGSCLAGSLGLLFRTLGLRQVPRANRFLKLDQQIGSDQQMLRFLGREREIAKDIAAGRRDLQSI